MRKRTKQQIIEELKFRVAQLQRDASLFGERLDEARRRTIPVRHGDVDCNFLPIAITKVDVRHDMKEFQGADGKTHYVRGRAEVTIFCNGDIIMSPNPTKPAKTTGKRINKAKGKR